MRFGLQILFHVTAALGSYAIGGAKLSDAHRRYEIMASDLLRSRGVSTEDITKVHELYMRSRAETTYAKVETDRPRFATFRSFRDWLYVLGSLVCVCCGAFGSGVSLGMLSLDPLDLELKNRAGTPQERKYASMLLPLVKRHHLLLVSLLLFNASANETLPLFLDNVVPPYVAIMVSVTLVLIFGEVVPSALFTGPRQLELSAKMALPTWFIIALVSPVAYPLAKVLDRALGREGLKRYTRKELKALVDVQHEVHEDHVISAAAARAMETGLSPHNHHHQNSSHHSPSTRRSSMFHMRPPSDGNMPMSHRAHGSSSQFSPSHTHTSSHTHTAPSYVTGGAGKAHGSFGQEVMGRVVERGEVMFGVSANLSVAGMSVKEKVVIDFLSGGDHLNSSVGSVGSLGGNRKEGRRHSAPVLSPTPLKGELQLQQCDVSDPLPTVPQRRTQLLLRDLPSSHSVGSACSDPPLTELEASMVTGILTHHHTTVREIMVHVDDCYGVSSHATITPELRYDMATAGFSRILVYDGHKANIRGFFHIKKLLLVDPSPSEPTAITALPLYHPIIVHERCTLGSLLTKLKGGASHLAVVSRDPMGTMQALMSGTPLDGTTRALGIATLEDVIESLLQQEIYDEDDRLRRDAHHRALRILQQSRLGRTGELLMEGDGLAPGAAEEHGSLCIEEGDAQKLATLIDELHDEAEDSDDASDGEVSTMTRKLLTEVLSSSSRTSPLNSPIRAFTFSSPAGAS